VHGCADGIHYLESFFNFDAAPLSIFMDPGKHDVIAPDAVVGGLYFENCTVIDDQPRPYFILNATWPDGTETRRLANVRYTGTVETTSKQFCRAVVSSAGTSTLALTPTTCTVKHPELEAVSAVAADAARVLKADDEEGAAAASAPAAAASSSPAILVGAHYFAGWYTCEGRAPAVSNLPTVL
jgi:hypothetical protein